MKKLLMVAVVSMTAGAEGLFAADDHVNVAKSETLSTSVAAIAAASDPHALVSSMTRDVLVKMESYRDTVDQDPEPFFQFLEVRLESVIDFKWIALNVMGPYRKSASEEQLERFATVFRRGLVETYGRGLLAYSNQKIEVLPPSEPIAGKRRVNVKQEIYGETQVYPVSYTMGLNRNQQWKVTNVIINGINIGKTFRNQFVQSAQKNGGDLDKVIDSWASEV